MIVKCHQRIVDDVPAARRLVAVESRGGGDGILRHDNGFERVNRPLFSIRVVKIVIDRHVAVPDRRQRKAEHLFGKYHVNSQLRIGAEIIHGRGASVSRHQLDDRVVSAISERVGDGFVVDVASQVKLHASGSQRVPEIGPSRDPCAITEETLARIRGVFRCKYRLVGHEDFECRI